MLILVEVELAMRDGTSRRAVAEGNNSAWACVCGRDLPLMGTTRPGAGDTQCGCGRAYRVLPHPHRGERVSEVREM